MNTSVFARLDSFLTFDQLMNEAHKLTDAMSAVINRLAVPDHMMPKGELIHDNHYALLSESFRGYRDRLADYNIKLDTQYNYIRSAGDATRGRPGAIQYIGGHDVTATVYASDAALARTKGLPEKIIFTFGTGPKGKSIDRTARVPGSPKSVLRSVLEFCAGIPPEESYVKEVKEVPPSIAVDNAKLYTHPEAIEVKDFNEMREKIAAYMEETGGIPAEPLPKFQNIHSPEILAADDAIGWVARNSHDTRPPVKGIKKWIDKDKGFVPEALPRPVSISLLAENLPNDPLIPALPIGIVHGSATPPVRTMPRSSSVVAPVEPTSVSSGRKHSSSHSSSGNHIYSMAAINEETDVTTRFLEKHMKEWTKDAKLCFSFVSGVACAALLGLGLHCLTSHDDEKGPNGGQVKRNHLIKGSSEIGAGLLLALLSKKSHDLIR